MLFHLSPVSHSPLRDKQCCTLNTQVKEQAQKLHDLLRSFWPHICQVVDLALTMCGESGVQGLRSLCPACIAHRVLVSCAQIWALRSKWTK